MHQHIHGRPPPKGGGDPRAGTLRVPDHALVGYLVGLTNFSVARRLLAASDLLSDDCDFFATARPLVACASPASWERRMFEHYSHISDGSLDAEIAHAFKRGSPLGFLLPLDPPRRRRALFATLLDAVCKSLLTSGASAPPGAGEPCGTHSRPDCTAEASGHDDDDAKSASSRARSLHSTEPDAAAPAAAMDLACDDSTGDSADGADGEPTEAAPLTPAHAADAAVAAALVRSALEHGAAGAADAGNKDGEDDDDDDDEHDDLAFCATASTARGVGGDFLGGPAPGGCPNTSERALDAVMEGLESEGAHLLMLEQAYDPTEPPEAICRGTVLAREHLIVPVDVGERALELFRQMALLVHSWPAEFGRDGLGAQLLGGHLLPAAESALELARAGRVRDALGDLLGVLMFGLSDSGWLSDAGLGPCPGAVRQLSRSLSAAWRLVLEADDNALGLAHPAGTPGGYRSTLHELLQSWQRDTNALLGKLRGASAARLYIDTDAAEGAARDGSPSPRTTRKRSRCADAAAPASAPPAQRCRAQ